MSNQKPNFDFSSLNLNFNFPTGGFPLTQSGSAASALGSDLQGPLLGAISSKLNSIVGASSGYYESLPESVKNRVDALKDLHSEYSELEKKFEEEVFQLELKYQELYRPLWKKRSDIVKGDFEPERKKETTAKDEKSKPQDVEEKKDEQAKEETETKGIPQFWLTVLHSHTLFDSTITEKDEDALKYLEDITTAPVPEEPRSFVLSFHFAENPYFEDKVLTKTYHLQRSEATENIICDHVDSTTIQWKEGKNLTKGATALGDSAGSFFLFFSPPDLPKKPPKDSDSMFQLQHQMEMDFDLAVILKDKIIPNAVMWFTGEAADSDEEDDDDNILNFDEEEYDSDEDQDYQPPQGLEGPKEGADQSPECKQQ